MAAGPGSSKKWHGILQKKQLGCFRLAIANKELGPDFFDHVFPKVFSAKCPLFFGY